MSMKKAIVILADGNETFDRVYPIWTFIYEQSDNILFELTVATAANWTLSTLIQVKIHYLVGGSSTTVVR